MAVGMVIIKFFLVSLVNCCCLAGKRDMQVHADDPHCNSLMKHAAKKLRYVSFLLLVFPINFNHFLTYRLKKHVSASNISNCQGLIILKIVSRSNMDKVSQLLDGWRRLPMQKLSRK